MATESSVSIQTAILKESGRFSAEPKTSHPSHMPLCCQKPLSQNVHTLKGFATTGVIAEKEFFTVMRGASVKNESLNNIKWKKKEKKSYYLNNLQRILNLYFVL